MPDACITCRAVIGDNDAYTVCGCLCACRNVRCQGCSTLRLQRKQCDQCMLRNRGLCTTAHQNAEEVSPTVQIDEDRAFVMWMAWTHTMYAQPLCQNDPYENSIRRTVPTIHETPQQRLQHELAQQRAGVRCWADPVGKMMTFRTLYDYREHWRKTVYLQNIWLGHVRAAFGGRETVPLQAPFS